MPSDIEFSPQEATLFVVLTGMRPPLIATETLYQVGDLANSTADRIDSELTPLVNELVNHVLTGMNTAVSPAFAQALSQYTSKPGYFPETSAQLRQMGDYAVSTAAQVEYMKVEAIATLASLIASLVAEAVLAFFFPEIGLEMMAAEFAIVRLILNTLIGRVLAHILSATLIGIAIQVLLDSIAQGVLIGEGIQQKWNWKETGLQIAVGALGGAMGLALHPVEHWATDELSGFLKNLLGKGGGNLVDDLAKDAPKDLADDLAKDAPKDLPVAPGGGPAKDLAADTPKELPDRGPAGLPSVDEPGWTGPTPFGSRDWFIENLAEIPVGFVIGGIHNAGHETLFDLMLTGQPTWSWSTFAGGAAQGIARSVGILAGGGSRMVFGLPLPAENLLAGAFGKVTPSMLNDIAHAPPEPPAEGPGSVLPQTDNKAAGPEPAPEPGKPDVVNGQSSGGPATVVEPPAVQLLRAAGIPPGPDTAYSIAVRTGFVPTIGPAEFHELYSRPLMVTLPPMTSSPGFAAAVLPALPGGPASPHDEPLPAYSLVDAPRPGSPSPLPTSAGGPGPAPAQPGAGLPGSRPDETLTSVGRPPIPAGDVPAPRPVEPGSERPGPMPDDPLPAEAGQFPVLTPDNRVTPADGSLPVTQAPPEPVPTSPGPGAPLPGNEGGQPLGQAHHGPVTHASGADRLREPGVASSGPNEAGGVNAGPSRHAAGTTWTRNDDGWHQPDHFGFLDRGQGAGGQASALHVPGRVARGVRRLGPVAARDPAGRGQLRARPDRRLVGGTEESRRGDRRQDRRAGTPDPGRRDQVRGAARERGGAR